MNINRFIKENKFWSSACHIRPTGPKLILQMVSGRSRNSYDEILLSVSGWNWPLTAVTDQTIGQNPFVVFVDKTSRHIPRAVPQQHVSTVVLCVGCFEVRQVCGIFDRIGVVWPEQAGLVSGGYIHWSEVIGSSRVCSTFVFPAWHS